MSDMETLWESQTVRLFPSTWKPWDIHFVFCADWSSLMCLSLLLIRWVCCSTQLFPQALAASSMCSGSLHLARYLVRDRKSDGSCYRSRYLSPHYVYCNVNCWVCFFWFEYFFFLSETFWHFYTLSFASLASAVTRSLCVSPSSHQQTLEKMMTLPVVASSSH